MFKVRLSMLERDEAGGASSWRGGTVATGGLAGRAMHLRRAQRDTEYIFVVAVLFLIGVIYFSYLNAICDIS